MSVTFDPYHKWLGIPPAQQPPTHYRLLGIERFEADPEVIDAAANQRMSYLQEVAGGDHIRESQKLLNEVAAARRCLLDPHKKEQYDAELRQASESVAAAVNNPRSEEPIVSVGSLAFAIDPKPARDSEVGQSKKTPVTAASKLPWIVGVGAAFAIVGVIVATLASGGNKEPAEDHSESPKPIASDLKNDREPDRPKPLPAKKKEPTKPAASAPEGPACKLHFQPARNLRGDPVGILYHEGEYHLFYQPTITAKWTNLDLWGHAVSRNLLTWVEKPVKHPTQVDAECLLVSVAVDHGNTSGLGKGKDPPFVALYTKQFPSKKDAKIDLMEVHLASSSDRGLTWTAYAKNPVLVGSASIDRQATLFRHEPSQQWVLLSLRPLPGGTEKEGQVKWQLSKDLKTWIHQAEPRLPAGSDSPDLFTVPLAGNPKRAKTICVGGDGRYLVGEYDGKSYKPEGGLIGGSLRGHQAPRATSGAIGSPPRTLQFYCVRPLKPGDNSPFGFPHQLTASQNKKDETWRVLRGLPRELESLRGKDRSWKDLDVKKGENPLADVTGDLLEFELDVERATAAEFTLVIAGEKYRYSFDKRRWFADGHEVPSGDGKTIRLRGFIDHDILELHFGVYPGTLTRVVPPRKGATHPLELLVADGGIRVTQMRVYDLRLPSSEPKKVAILP